MITKELTKTIHQLVEQKMIEFFGDPDNGLPIKKSFLGTMKKRLEKKQQFHSHKSVLKKYGINQMVD